MHSSILGTLISEHFLASAIRLATPMLIAAMGGIFSERSGVLFMGMEGFMLVGAFAGFVGSYLFGPAAGILVAAAAGLLLGLLYAFGTVTLSSNQVVLCVAVNIFALGITSALFRTVFGDSTSQIQCPTLKPVEIPFLSGLPVLGAFFKQTIFSYLGYLLVPTAWLVFFRTDWGLAIRAVGENPRAAATAGIDPRRVRYACILWASAFGAVAGASQTVGDLGLFVDNMIAGKGFIVFASIILGGFTPIGALVAVFFFGVVDAFQLNLQALGSTLPYQFPLMLPYLLTLVAYMLAGYGSAPKAWGASYGDE